MRRTSALQAWSRASLQRARQGSPYLQGVFPRDSRPCQVGADGATLHLDRGFLLTAPAELVYQAPSFMLHLDPCQLP